MDKSHTDAELNSLSREVKNDNKEMHRRRAEKCTKKLLLMRENPYPWQSKKSHPLG